MRGDLVERAWKVRARINQWIGIPCGIGIATTKTLAKLANHIAKTAERKPGTYPDGLATVCDLSRLGADQLREVMASTDVGEVWGIGRQISAQLKERGVKSVQDFVELPCSVVRGTWGVVLGRTWRELRGDATSKANALLHDKVERSACGEGIVADATGGAHGNEQ